jgi:hypothetical protein
LGYFLAPISSCFRHACAPPASERYVFFPGPPRQTASDLGNGFGANLCGTAAAHEMDNYENDREHEQDVNEESHNVENDERPDPSEKH